MAFFPDRVGRVWEVLRALSLNMLALRPGFRSLLTAGPGFMDQERT